MKVRIRPLKPGDEAFVYSRWLQTWTTTADLPRAVVNDGVRKMVDRVLTNPRTTVKVATNAEDDREILGFAVATGDVLSTVFVRAQDRQIGVARALLAELPPALRAWWPHRALKYLARCSAITVEPTAVYDL